VRIETAASSRVSKQERIGNVAYMRPSWLTEDLLEVQRLSARRVLIRLPNWLGDLLMARPLLGNAVLLVLAAIKGRRIALDFMDLRAVPALWRGLVSAWILIVVLFAWLASAVTALI